MTALAPILSELPPRLAARLVGVSVETTVLLLLPPSRERAGRLSELREGAKLLALECAPFVSITFRELEAPQSWRDAYHRRLAHTLTSGDR